MFVVPVVFGVVPPVCKVGSVGCVGFLVEGTGACVLVDLVFLVGRISSGDVF